MTITTEPAVDIARVHAFAGQVLTDHAAAASSALVYLGRRLGLYRELSAGGAQERATGGMGSVPRVEVVVAEDFDLNAIPRMRTLLDEALALNPRELVVDLESCQLADAAAIGLLLDAHRRARRAGGMLTLRSPSPRLRRNLRLARVDAVLQVAPFETAVETAPLRDER